MWSTLDTKRRRVVATGEPQFDRQAIRVGDAFAEDNNNVKINGFKIRYPKNLKDQQISMIDGELKIQFAEFSFEIRDGEIWVGDLNHGPASSGDRILIGFKGAIAVNGKRIEPRRDN